MSELAWALTINSNSKDLRSHVVSFEYSTSVDLLDALTVELEVDDPTARSTLLGICVPGTTWSLTIGTLSFSGDVVGVSWSVGRFSRPRILVHGLEKLHRIRHLSIFAIAEQAPSAVASTLLAKSSLSPTVQTLSTPSRPVLNLDETAMSYVKQVAHDFNYVIVMDGTSLKFQPHSTVSTKGTVTLDYSLDVLDARIQTDLTDVVTAVTVHGNDYTKTDGPYSYTTAATDLKKISGGDTAVSLRNTIAAAAVVIDHQGRWGSTSEATDRAKGELTRRAERFLSGTYQCRGVEITPASTLKVTNISWPFTGPFRVASVSWSMSRGVGIRTVINVFSDSLPTK